MTIETKIKEVVIVPTNESMSIAVFKEDLIIDNGIVVGHGTKGEYTESFTLLYSQINSVIEFIESLIGNSLPDAHEIVAVNVQINDDKMYLSLASNQSLFDVENNKIGQTSIYRQVVELTEEQQNLVADFVYNQVAIMNSDFQSYTELLNSSIPLDN